MFVRDITFELPQVDLLQTEMMVGIRRPSRAHVSWEPLLSILKGLTVRQAFRLVWCLSAIGVWVTIVGPGFLPLTLVLCDSGRDDQLRVKSP
jgi:hypothetical protein